MRTPSWKMSFVCPDTLPGVMPPTSPQCARLHANITSRLRQKMGLISATSFRCVPDVNGSFARITSPG